MSTTLNQAYHAFKIDRTATFDEIKSAYRKLAKQLHPDLNPSPNAAEEFKQLTVIYDFLLANHKPARKKAVLLGMKLYRRIALDDNNRAIISLPFPSEIEEEVSLICMMETGPYTVSEFVLHLPQGLELPAELTVLNLSKQFNVRILPTEAPEWS